MSSNKYEFHTKLNPLLPFILHTAVHGLPRQLPNWHENLEVLYCIEGSSSVKYNDSTYTMHPGDILVINSDVIHCVLNPDKVVYHCFIIDRSFCEANGIPAASLYFQELIHDAFLSDAFLKIFSTYDAYVNTQAFYGIAEIRARITDFLCILCKFYIRLDNMMPKSNIGETVKAAMLYIKQNYTKHITLEEISCHAGISKSYLSRAFKKYTGRTVFDTIMKIRCSEAKLLIQSGSSVSQAAFSCGFESLPYFSRTFKKYYNKPPSHYLSK